MLSSKTFSQQQKLASYCRTNILPEDLKVRKENVVHYRRLVFNIILDMMETMYPVSKKLFSEEEWEQLIHRFFSNYKCTDPQVWKMPRFLIEYVRKQEKEVLNQYPFLPDLLILEWKELEWFTNEDRCPVALKHKIPFIGESFTHFLPHYEILLFDYPVFLSKSPEEWKKNQGKYFVLIYRNPENDKVYYDEISIWISFVWTSITEQKPFQEIKNELALYLSQNGRVATEAEQYITETLHYFKKIKLLY